MMRKLLQLALSVHRFYWWLVRPVTRGVRAILVNQDGQVLLLRHKYGKGWLLPGGRVRKHESYETALRRELREELGVTELELGEKLGEYQNEQEYKRDTIVVFVSRSFTLAPKCHFEIETWGFLDPRELPDGTSPGTRRRIEEWLGERTTDSNW
jgi:8-oxo-dGTP pyrophosphatase MutT (NUDIX family)